jgi:VWFA-related protein
VTVILFDGLNTPADQQATAKLKVIAYLRNISTVSPIAIYYLGNTLALLHDFTEDHQSLIDALNRKGVRPNGEVADSSPEPANVGSDPLFNAAVDKFNTVFAERAITERGIGTAQALRTIQAHISRVPGRKNLVWLAGSFPAGASGFSDTAVYPVSTMGLETGILPLEGRPGKSDPNLGAAAIYRTPVEPFREFANSLAADTGGRTFYGVNDFGAAIQSAIDDSRVTYSIAFSPPVESLDGRNHALKVAVKRPGVSLRYRSKYFASSATTLPSLEEAIRSRDSIPSIGLEVEMKAKVDGLTAFIRVDPQDITFTERNVKWEASLVTVVGTTDKIAPMTPVHISLSRESYSDVRKRGFELVQHLPPSSTGGEYLIAVQDSVSGQIGTLRFVR